MTIIKTKDFVLRHVQLKDLKGYYETETDEVSKKMFMSFPKDLDEAKKDILKHIKDNKNKDYVSETFSIIVNGDYAGYVKIQFQNFDRKSEEGRIHIAIHPKFREKGLATKVIKAATDYGFEEKNFKRIFGQCKAINKPLLKILKKIGFKKLKVHEVDGVKKVLLVLERDLKIIAKKCKDLTGEDIKLLIKARKNNFGDKKDYKKDFEPDTIFFFVRDENKLVSVGGLRPIEINYLGKNYKIKGICHVVAIEKKKNYGKQVIQAMINYLKKNQKTGLGFCGKHITKFYEIAGLKTKNDFIKRFVYLKPNGEKVVDNDGDGLYYEGKDKFISKVLKTKSIVYINVEHW